MENILYSILFFAAGIFCLAGAYFNWDFFFNARKSRRIADLFGRNGARIFYAVLGIFIIVMGVLVSVSPE